MVLPFTNAIRTGVFHIGRGLFSGNPARSGVRIGTRKIVQAK